MKRIFIAASLTFMLALISTPAFSGTIDVLIKGVDDGVKINKQQDYKEAVMNAKLQAIERAGVKIQSITRVVNFQTKFDMVESKAKAILLPGFQIMDMGYQTDGTYQVVLSGKIQTGGEESKITPAGLMRKAEIELIKAKKTKERGEQLKHYKEVLYTYKKILEKFNDSPEALSIVKQDLTAKIEKELLRPAQILITSKCGHWNVSLDDDKMLNFSHHIYFHDVSTGVHHVRGICTKVPHKDKGGTVPEYMSYDQTVEIEYPGETVQVQIPCIESDLVYFSFFDSYNWSHEEDLIINRKDGSKEKIGVISTSGRRNYHFVVFKGDVLTRDSFYRLIVKLGSKTKIFEGHYDWSEEVVQKFGPLQIHVSPMGFSIMQAAWIEE